MKKSINLLRNPSRIVPVLANRGFFNWLPDSIILKIQYKDKMGKKLDLDKPKSFAEKIQWLKLYYRDSEYTMLVDKFSVREHVRVIIGEEYLIPIFGVWDRFENINFSELPDKFVLKCTHDSGGIVICKDKNKFDVKEAKKIINKSIKRNFYYYGREWPYKNVKPRIICEELLNDNCLNESLTDYKFYCFDGDAKYCQVIRGRGTNETIDFYDKNWKHMPFTGLRNLPNSKRAYDKPEAYDHMIWLAEQLSKNFPFIRVDLYNIKGKIYFGELTFFPKSGYGQFYPDKWNYEIGSLIDIPKYLR